MKTSDEYEETSTSRRPAAPRGRPRVRVAATVVVAVAVALLPGTADAQEGQQRTIELETIEIESEVPRRVAQFFVQRDQLQYEEMEEEPTFIPELLESVEDEPF